MTNGNFSISTNTIGRTVWRNVSHFLSNNLATACDITTQASIFWWMTPVLANLPFTLSGHANLRICIDEERECATMIENGIDDGSSLKFKSCDCKESCNIIYYNTDFKVNKISPKHLKNFTSNGDFALESEILIYFGADEYYGLRRSSRFHAASFLSQLGALLWLFVGASLLSIIEVIYFFTVRLFRNFLI